MGNDHYLKRLILHTAEKDEKQNQRIIRPWSTHLTLRHKNEHDLTHLCGMDFPISINWMSSFPILGLLSGIFHLCSNFNRTLCNRTVETLIRRYVMWRLIWVCTVCLSPTKRTLGLYVRIYNVKVNLESS